MAYWNGSEIAWPTGYELLYPIRIVAFRLNQYFELCLRRSRLEVAVAALASVGGADALDWDWVEDVDFAAAEEVVGDVRRAAEAVEVAAAAVEEQALQMHSEEVAVGVLALLAQAQVLGVQIY